MRSTRFLVAVALGVMVLLTSQLAVGAADSAWDLDADFSAGTPVDVVVDSDSMALDTYPDGLVDPTTPWYEPDWHHRFASQLRIQVLHFPTTRFHSRSTPPP